MEDRLSAERCEAVRVALDRARWLLLDLQTKTAYSPNPDLALIQAVKIIVGTLERALATSSGGPPASEGG